MKVPNRSNGLHYMSVATFSHHVMHCISAHFQLRCNRKMHYIIKGERPSFFSPPFLVLLKKTERSSVIFSSLSDIYTILKDVTSWEDHTDVSRIVRIIFFILLFIGFSLPGVTAVSSPLAVASSSFGGGQWAHAENFMNLTESQQSQCVLKNRETSLSEELQRSKWKF